MDDAQLGVVIFAVAAALALLAGVPDWGYLRNRYLANKKPPA